MVCVRGPNLPSSPLCTALPCTAPYHPSPPSPQPVAAGIALCFLIYNTLCLPRTVHHACDQEIPTPVFSQPRPTGCLRPSSMLQLPLSASRVTTTRTSRSDLLHSQSHHGCAANHVSKKMFIAEGLLCLSCCTCLTLCFVAVGNGLLGSSHTHQIKTS